MADPLPTDTVTTRTRSFTIDLPRSWLASEHPDRFEFDAPDGVEQVIVQVLSARATMSADERASVVGEIFESRQTSLIELANGSGMLLPASIEHTGESSVLAYVGTDFANRVLMYGRIIARGASIVVASYYRYTLEGSLLEFVARAQPACASLMVT